MDEKAIREMASWVLFTGKISEWHQKNMQNFALIAFKNLLKVEIEYDFGSQDKSGCFVVYRISAIPKKRIGKSKKEILKRMDDCSRWTRNIFWDDLRVEFMDGNGKALVSERPKEPRQKKPRSKKLPG